MYNGLIHLGFSSKDFLLIDNSDGKGVFIGEWNSDKPQPSVEEIKTAQDAYETEYTSNKYQRDREPLYGTWKEQLDMMYHGTCKDNVDKIKSDIPKG